MATLHLLAFLDQLLETDRVTSLKLVEMLLHVCKWCLLCNGVVLLPHLSFGCGSDLLPKLFDTVLGINFASS